MTSQRPPGDFPVNITGRAIRPVRGFWKTGEEGMARLGRANRLTLVGSTLCYVRYINDFPVFPLTNLWSDTGTSGFGASKIYVVQTNQSIVERCILMATDPGDGYRSYMRVRYDSIRFGAMGSSVDHSRHLTCGCLNRPPAPRDSEIRSLPLAGRDQGSDRRLRLSYCPAYNVAIDHPKHRS